jgi:hypothetical protein
MSFSIIPLFDYTLTTVGNLNRLPNEQDKQKLQAIVDSLFLYDRFRYPQTFERNFLNGAFSVKACLKEIHQKIKQMETGKSTYLKSTSLVIPVQDPLSQTTTDFYFYNFKAAPQKKSLAKQVNAPFFISFQGRFIKFETQNPKNEIMTETKFEPNDHLRHLIWKPSKEALEALKNMKLHPDHILMLNGSDTKIYVIGFTLFSLFEMGNQLKMHPQKDVAFEFSA